MTARARATISRRRLIIPTSPGSLPNRRCLSGQQTKKVEFIPGNEYRRCCAEDKVVEAMSDSTVEWLLAGDPAIRWQALRDLVGAPPGRVERQRSRIAREGGGRRLLGRQDARGTWAGGLYSPKWTSTTYTMLLLRDFGLPSTNRRARKACALLLDQGLQPDGGINYGRWASWIRRSETCITGMVLSILSYFEFEDDRVDTIARHLLEQQMTDGGWNCARAARPTARSTPRSALWRASGITNGTVEARFGASGALSSAVASSFWCIGCSALTVRVKSSKKSSSASPFLRAGTTTFFARSTTSSRLTPLAIDG
jgi:hypothetical protein